MTKISGSYESLSRGVSQQLPEARLPGQHGEQVNMWTDPVHGLSRRRGTTLQDCLADNVFGPSYFTLDEGDQQELREFYASYRTVPYTASGKEFLVHYPTKPLPSWMGGFNGGQGGIKVTEKLQNRSANQPGAIAGSLSAGTGAPATATTARINKGLIGAVQVGRYMLLYPADQPFVHGADVELWDTRENSNASVQIKAGIPNRTYTIRFRVNHLDGSVGFSSVAYTTPPASYTGTLTTSDIAFSDPEYTKKVNDRVNAYNSAVTAWITTAANQTRPQYIAAQLLSGLQVYFNTGSGFPTGTLWLQDSATLAIRDLGIGNGDWEVSDGGDGSGIALTYKTVTSVDKLTNSHITGTIVRVKPDQDGPSYYLRARASNGSSDSPPRLATVRWEEAARSARPVPACPFVVLAFNPGTGIVGAATNLADLKTVTGISTLELPDFSPRLIGDADTNTDPEFVNKQVNWIGMFQDRLCMATGSVVNMSEVGNYFNFYRTQTLTVPDNDPVEIYALGAEADTIRHSVIFDRSLVLFGDLQQYSIDGRNPVTPATTTIIQSGSVEDTTDCPPVAGGNLVFFGKRREGSTEVFQMEIGNVADTSNYSGLGMQLSDYLPGRPSQLVHVASPGILFVRTDAAPHSVFVFRFIDQNGKRLLDAWSRFDYHPAFGIIHSMFYHDDALYFRVAREAYLQDGVLYTGGRGDYGFDVLERQSILPQLSGLVYLDSQRPVDSLWQDGSGYGVDFIGKSYPFLSSAFTKDKIKGVSPGGPRPPDGPLWLHGAAVAPHTLALWNSAFEDLVARDLNYCVAGLPFESRVELTSPVRRNQEGASIVQGRLNVGKLEVFYKETGGFAAEVTTRNGIAATYQDFQWAATNTAYGTVTALRFNGRVLGQAANMVGVIPVTTGSAAVFVGRESRDYTCTVKSRSWMPLAISKITWTGQWFLNHRNV